MYLGIFFILVLIYYIGRAKSINDFEFYILFVILCVLLYFVVKDKSTEYFSEQQTDYLLLLLNLSKKYKDYLEPMYESVKSKIETKLKKYLS